MKCSHHTHYAPCCKPSSPLFVDVCSGDSYRPPCKRYDCRACARRKRRELLDAIRREFSGSRMRLCTLTARINPRYDPRDYDDAMNAAWRQFIKRLRQWERRRRPGVRAFRYVRVSERTKQGAIHFHVGFDSFLPRKVIEGIWVWALSIELRKQCLRWEGETCGTSDIRGEDSGDMDCDRLAHYLSKYLVKSFSADLSFHESRRIRRRFTSSRTFKLRRPCPIVESTRYRGHWVRIPVARSAAWIPSLVSLRLMPSISADFCYPSLFFDGAESLPYGARTATQGRFWYESENH